MMPRSFEDCTASRPERGEEAMWELQEQERGRRNTVETIRAISLIAYRENLEGESVEGKE